MAARSYLYVPGDDPRKLAGASARGADALIIDLEDAVPPDRKAYARDLVRRWLSAPPPGTEIWVRVNDGEAREADTAAVAEAGGAAGLCLAKVRDPREALAVSRQLDRLGSPLALAPVLETPAAVLDARAVAEVPRVVRLHLGEADLRAELGIEPAADERELLWLRSLVVTVSAAAGIEPPPAPVSTDFRDTDALTRTTRALKRLGFRGRACIHPAQVPVVNAVFTPTADELRRAERLVARFSANGAGAGLDEDGRMIDEAVVRTARRVVQWGRTAGTAEAAPH
ncbi:CoA ester lyase [Streptomyces sp. NBC_01754]|uniref:HpcH/HpaI aldolase/citrate lyase family protein n=1 Tax=Streptomyces sp. NBC_01754 TaxID=2975930 RepID=UPI002DDA1516|nr:CoA ester lyase [Streptomyces sp. NBC_01754]WSC91823.1 CoA ester lyase [Streptomyces sp. NBC_01754]